MMKLTAVLVQQYQAELKTLKTIGEFKALGRKLRDECGLTDREAIDILNDRNVTSILAKYEGV